MAETHKGLTQVRDYARQRLAGHTRLSRQEYIAAVVEEGRRLECSESLAAQTARYAWDSRWGRIDPNEQPAPEPEMDLIPIPVPPVEGRQESYSLQELLQRVDLEGGPIEVPPLMPLPEARVLPPPIPPVPVDDALSDASARRAAKATVRKAVADVNRITSEQQMRYEVALMASNKNVEAMQKMQVEAAVRAITVEALADMIINERRARERRAYQVYAIEAQALKDIDDAHGDSIGEIASRAAKEIRNGDDQ